MEDLTYYFVLQEVCCPNMYQDLCDLPPLPSQGLVPGG